MFRIAVFGAGPSGFYAVEDLLKQTAIPVEVDLFDRLPTPYGLVRGGVAPDHQKIKAVIRQYEKIARRPGFRFFGNVTFGETLTLDEVLAHYHQVLFTTGAESDRHMGIPGEDLPGSYSATQFVGWYNGHPDYRHLDFALDHIECVAVIGNGNVAVDVARVLLRAVEELATTDIAEHALNALRTSKVTEVFMLGRRGPAQAAFTNVELRELTELTAVNFIARAEELELSPVDQEFLAAHASELVHQRNLDILHAHQAKQHETQPRKLHARFLVSPVEILGTDRVEGIRLEKNRLVRSGNGGAAAQGTGEYEELPCQMVLRSIGYKGLRLPEIPFDEKTGTIPNREGRVIDPSTSRPFPRLYVAGWIKRGPSGVIGTNKPDAAATVEAMLADLQQGEFSVEINSDPETIPALLTHKQARYISFADWQHIDQLEIAQGKKVGKPREKFTTIPELLALVKSQLP